MNQKSIEHIALYSLVLVGTLVVGVLARQFVLSKGVDDFSSSVAFFATVIVLMAIYASLQTTFNQFLLPRIETFPPIIRDRNNERRQYRNMLRLVNNNLKKISILAGLHTNLTMYVSRHSWASAAKDQNIPLSVISEGMGHDSENTTLIYLASLDTSRVDMANELILEKL